MTNTTDEWLWTDWKGRECPIADDVEYKVRLNRGDVIHDVKDASYWDWFSAGLGQDVAAPTIRKGTHND